MKTQLFLPLAIAVLCLPAQAQYKVVAPDGTVTYTDRPPPAAASAVRVNPGSPNRSAPAADTTQWLLSLPLVLREPATRFPVTLYAAAACDPCDRARALLRLRGIPFRERLATTDADRDAWPRVVGSPDAPALTVGSQFLRGFAPEAWQETLDVAGYPRDSRLPPGYRAPAPTPLTEPRPVAPAPEPPAAVPPPAAPAEPVQPAASGIRF
jgi:glutaredoxin